MLLFGIATKKCCYFGKHQKNDAILNSIKIVMLFPNSNQKRLLFQIATKNGCYFISANKIACTSKVQSKQIALFNTIQYNHPQKETTLKKRRPL